MMRRRQPSKAKTVTNNRQSSNDIGRGLTSGHILWYPDDNCSPDNSSSNDSDNSSSSDSSSSDSSSGGE